MAATIYPVLMTVYALYTDQERPTKFGKGLFIGMAFVAGAGSIITLLGAARGAVAIGFFKGIAERDVSFFVSRSRSTPLALALITFFRCNPASCELMRSCADSVECLSD